jgi:hypothetical protein
MKSCNFCNSPGLSGHIQAGESGQDLMIDLFPFVLFQQADGLAIHDRAGIHVLAGDEIAIQVVPIFGGCPQDKTVRVRIRLRGPDRPLEVQSFFVIDMHVRRTGGNLYANLDHGGLLGAQHLNFFNRTYGISPDGNLIQEHINVHQRKPFHITY